MSNEDYFNEDIDPMRYMTVKVPYPEGSTVEIIHNPYTKFQEYTSGALKLGQRATVLKTGKLMKSRKEGLDVYYCIIKFTNDGSIGNYFSSNLKRIA